MQLINRAILLPPADPVNGATRSLLLPENFPDPAPIVGSRLVIAGAPWPSGEPYQFFHVGIDPRGQFFDLTGFPSNESASYDNLIALNFLEKWPGNSGQGKFGFVPSPFYRYSRSAGDRLYFEAYGNGTQFQMNVALTMEVDDNYVFPDPDNMVDNYTTFLLANNGTNFYDRSFIKGGVAGAPLPYVGSAPQIYAGWSHYGAGYSSAMLDGSGGFEIPHSPQFLPGVSTWDFTWEVAFRPDDMSAQPMAVLSKWNGTTNGSPYHLYVNGGRLLLIMSSTTNGREIANNLDCGPIVEGSSYYVMISRRGDAFRVYVGVNGGTAQKVNEWTVSTGLPLGSNTEPLRIGFMAGPSKFFKGPIDAVRLTDHFARRYGGDFTPWPVPPT